MDNPLGLVFCTKPAPRSFAFRLKTTELAFLLIATPAFLVQRLFLFTDHSWRKEVLPACVLQGGLRLVGLGSSFGSAS